MQGSKVRTSPTARSADTSVAASANSAATADKFREKYQRTIQELRAEEKAYGQLGNELTAKKGEAVKLKTEVQKSNLNLLECKNKLSFSVKHIDTAKKDYDKAYVRYNTVHEDTVEMETLLKRQLEQEGIAKQTLTKLVQQRNAAENEIAAVEIDVRNAVNERRKLEQETLAIKRETKKLQMSLAQLEDELEQFGAVLQSSDDDDDDDDDNGNDNGNNKDSGGVLRYGNRGDEDLLGDDYLRRRGGAEEEEAEERKREKEEKKGGMQSQPAGLEAQGDLDAGEARDEPHTSSSSSPSSSSASPSSSSPSPSSPSQSPGSSFALSNPNPGDPGAPPTSQPL